MPVYRLRAPAVKQVTVDEGTIHERTLPAYRALDMEVSASRNRVHYFANQFTAQGRREVDVTFVGHRMDIPLSDFIKNVTEL